MISLRALAAEEQEQEQEQEQEKKAAAQEDWTKSISLCWHTRML